MSTIILIKDNDKFQIGSRDITNYGNTIINTINDNNNPIWKDKFTKDIIIGHVGRDLYTNLLKTTNFFENEDVELTYKLIVEVVIPKYFEIVNEVEKHEKEKGISLNSQIVFIQKDKAFLFSNNGSVYEVEDFAILASSNDRDFYHGAYFASENLNPEDRIKRILTEANNYLTQNRVNFITTDSINFNHTLNSQ